MASLTKKQSIAAQAAVTIPTAKAVGGRSKEDLKNAKDNISVALERYYQKNYKLLQVRAKAALLGHNPEASVVELEKSQKRQERAILGFTKTNVYNLKTLKQARNGAPAIEESEKKVGMTRRGGSSR